MISQNLKRSRGAANEFSRTYNSKSKMDQYLGGNLVMGLPDSNIGHTAAGLVMNGGADFFMGLD